MKQMFEQSEESRATSEGGVEWEWGMRNEDSGMGNEE